MKPSLRDPLDGFWTPEFRAWLKAYERHWPDDVVAVLDARAQTAATKLDDSWGLGRAPDEPV